MWKQVLTGVGEFPGYRSPLRPVPEDAIPDLSTFFNSGQINHPANSMVPQVCCDKSTNHSSPLDSWWLEAVRVANDIETQHQIFELGNKASFFLPTCYMHFFAAISLMFFSG